MSVEINREEVERRRTRLLDEYGADGVETVEETWESPPERFDGYVKGSRDGYVGGGYCWVVRTAEQFAALTESMVGAEPDGGGERALLILSRGSDEWGVAGGGLEGDETYEEAAVREVREETAIDCEVSGLHRLEHVERRSTDPDDDRTCHLLYVYFDACYADGEIAIQPGELHGAAWFSRAPTRLDPSVERRAAEWFV